MGKGAVEPYGQAGISGSDIGDEGFRLASGVMVGPGEPSIPVPPPPPPPVLKRRVSLVGDAPPVRPELRAYPVDRRLDVDRESARILRVCVSLGLGGVVFTGIMVWANLIGLMR